MKLLRALLNLDREMFQGDSSWELRLADAWPHPALAALALAALVCMVALFYRREVRTVGQPVRAALPALRLVVLLALFAAALAPTLVVKSEKRDKSHVLLLVDESRSMLLADHYEDSDRAGVAAALKAAGGAPAARDISAMTRLDIAGRIAGRLRDLWRARRDFDVSVYAFAERLRAVEDAAGARRTGPVALAAAGDRTEIGTALSQLLRRFRGQDVAAVVVLSDGCNNAGFLPASAVDLARERATPVYALGIGNPRHPRDIAVANLIASDTLLVNDPADFAADVQAWGYGGGTNGGAEALLFEEAAGAPPREVGRQAIRLGADGERVPVRFEYTPGKVGEMTYRVEVAPRADEARPDNNRESAAVSVVEATLRVLYVSYEPAWEYRVLSRALIQDKMVHAACWLQSADPQFTQDGDESLDKLPESLETLVRREKPPADGAAPADGKKPEFIGYDVVILAGIDPSDVTEKFTDAVVRFVRDQGGGLMFVAGAKMTPHMLRNSRAQELLTLLPVEIEDKHDTSNYGKRLFADEFHLRLTPEAAGLRMMELARTPEESRRLWERTLPGFNWYYPVRRAKPGAVVVAVHEKDPDLASSLRRDARQPMPVLAWHFFGKGRVMFMGVDSTWRWRKDVGDKYFYKFWSQALHYLGKGSLLKKLGGVTITTDKPEYVVGDTVGLQARVIDEKTLEPSPAERQVAVIQKVDPGARPQTVPLAGTDEKGRYEGSWKAGEMGVHEVWLQAGGKRGDERPGLRTVDVQLPAQEKGDVRIDAKTLAGLAAAGGAFIEPARLGEAERLPDRVQPVAEPRVVQRAQTLWDAPAVLALLAALLVAEWILRKQRGLT